MLCRDEEGCVSLLCRDEVRMCQCVGMRRGCVSVLCEDEERMCQCAV